MKNFQWRVRVYYEDTDAGGVVYYANYLRFYERARTERLRAWGYEQDQLRQETGLVFAVRSVAVDYLRPARFNDQLLVTADVSRVKRASLEFSQKITSEVGCELLSRARIRVACVDSETFTPRTIPSIMLDKITDDI
jgi:acyl-CoA thioester hydrolase